MTTKSFKTRIIELEKELTIASTKATQFDAIATAVGADLVSQPAKIASLVKMATDRHRELVDEIVKEERLQGIVGDTEKAVAEAKVAYDDWPPEKLKRWHERITGANAPATAQLKGGDPNSTGADPGDLKNQGKQVDEKGLPTLLANPAITGVQKL